MTREEFLGVLADRQRPLFTAIGLTYPDKMRLSCGFPKGRARAGKAVGQCWTDEASADGTTEIFISPALGDVADVAHILTHELIHACVGIKEKHGGKFKTSAIAIGLTGKMTSTVPTPELAAKLKEITDALPPYPHAELREIKRETVKQPTRMIKLVCVDQGCKWTCRTTQKWLDIGTPTCPCGDEMAPEQKEGDE